MKSQNISKFVLSFFGTGYSPLAPGTIGSLATIPFIYIFSLYPISIYFYIFFIILLTIVSGLITDKVQKELNQFDPSWIVIDEVIGMLISWVPLYPVFEPIEIVILFILFRFFDIVKVWPANVFDKKMKSGFGTILDDVISGIYAALLLYLAKLLHYL